MRHDDPLRAKLNALEEAIDPHLRARAFERIVAEIFTRAGFDVVMNPEAAAPRQTDVYASDSRDGYLIEAKWRSDRIGSPEVDDIRSRLARQPSHVVGVLVAMGGAAERAFAEIERDRSRVVVVIDRPEVHALVEGGLDLRRLLSLKRRQLVVHAKASGAQRGSCHRHAISASRCSWLMPLDQSYPGSSARPAISIAAGHCRSRISTG